MTPEPNKRAPGEGGWVPPAWAPLVAAIGASILTAVGTAVGEGGFSIPALARAILNGAGTGLATFLGMRSAGPRKVE